MMFDENVLVNYDWYHLRYAWRHIVKGVRAWIEETGHRSTHQFIDEPGITVRANRTDC
jgi:hypothetical protein